MKIFELSTNPLEAFIRTNSFSNGMVMPHIHEGYEMSLILSGNMRYMFKDYSADITKGVVLLIKPFEIHKTLPSDKQYKRFLFHFKRAIFTDLFSEEVTNELLSVFSNNQIYLNDSEMEYVAETMMLCKNYLDDGKTDIATIHLAKSLLCMQNACLHPPKKTATSAILEILLYVNNHISTVTISDLSKKFYMSPQSLNKIFNKELSMTPSKYIESLRINYSMELLKEDNLSIDEVAYYCGFASASYFSSKFKMIIGQSPKAFRKQFK